mmetsp:Transcript_7759/g.23051  ORF Transcript_7759/g.23051 Transcript_7759/m.23051 type:complete len:301 (-) Transcript_7759:13-915(-)
MRALLRLAALAAAAAKTCRNQHEDCDAWAARGECDANPSYMHDSCAPACGTCGVRRDAFGHAIDLWGPEMTDHDRDTFANNLRINSDQPPTVPAFTAVGFEVVPIPERSYRALREARAAALAKGKLRREGCTRGYLNNCGAHPTYVMPYNAAVRKLVAAETQRRLEEWVGDDPWGGLTLTSVYGIRRYTNGSTLQVHVDVVATHAVSAILNVGQDVNTDWPLQIADHAGGHHSVIMRPGEMCMYESAKAIHGRVLPLDGDHFDNIFVHFRPTRGWERYMGVPNGGVVSDHGVTSSSKDEL